MESGLELEQATRELPMAVSEEQIEQAEIKLCSIEDPSCESCQ